MSDAAEEAMDSAVSEEEVEDQHEPSQEDQTSPNKRGSKISAVGEIIEGKRPKKTVERLDFQAPKQREKLRIGDGSGDKLGDIPRTSYQITKMKPADLKPLHAILFDRPGKMATIKKNLRLFNGFAFDADSEQFAKKREKLLNPSPAEGVSEHGHQRRRRVFPKSDQRRKFQMSRSRTAMQMRSPGRRKPLQPNLRPRRRRRTAAATAGTTQRRTARMTTSR